MSTRKTIALETATLVLGAKPEHFENPLTVLASPAWRGIEGDIWLAKAKNDSTTVKHYHPDTAFYVDTAAAIDAAAIAGSAGVGPSVLNSNPEQGIVAFEFLDAPWRSGGLQDVVNAEVRSNTIAAKKCLQNGRRFAKDASIFDEIAALYTIIKDGKILTHRHVGIFLDFTTSARDKIGSLGADSTPCHRDGNTANIMVGENNAVKLIDFDLAANADPFEDMGCYLIEFFEREPEARQGFEEWHGRFDEGLFQRAMLYGIADDLRWGLIASIMAATSPRSALEYAKYASWRFMRLETMTKRSDAGDRIRIAA